MVVAWLQLRSHPSMAGGGPHAHMAAAAFAPEHGGAHTHMAAVFSASCALPPTRPMYSRLRPDSSCTHAWLRWPRHACIAVDGSCMLPTSASQSYPIILSCTHALAPCTHGCGVSPPRYFGNSTAKLDSSNSPLGLSSFVKGWMLQWSVPSTSQGLGLRCCQ